MVRLNGWQRIGIVLSVLWTLLCIGVMPFVVDDAGSHAQTQLSDCINAMPAGSGYVDDLTFTGPMYPILRDEYSTPIPKGATVGNSNVPPPPPGYTPEDVVKKPDISDQVIAQNAAEDAAKKAPTPPPGYTVQAFTNCKPTNNGYSTCDPVPPNCKVEDGYALCSKQPMQFDATPAKHLINVLPYVTNPYLAHTASPWHYSTLARWNDEEHLSGAAACYRQTRDSLISTYWTDAGVLALVVVLSLSTGWGGVYGVLWTVRWVRRGFGTR
jgi:hypothetical protein